MHTPSRHRPLVLAYDSNPSSDGSVSRPPLRPRPSRRIVVRLHRSGRSLGASAFTRAGSGAAAASAQQKQPVAAAAASAAASDRLHKRWAVVMCCDESLWLNPIRRPRVNPAPRKHSVARCNQWRQNRLKNNANAAQIAQIALARYSEATERERLVQSVQCRRSTLALQC